LQAVLSFSESKGAYLSMTCLAVVVRHYQFWIRHVYQFHHTGIVYDYQRGVDAWHYSDAARLYNNFL